MAEAFVKSVPRSLLAAVNRVNGDHRWDVEVRRRVAGQTCSLKADWEDPLIATLEDAEVTSRGTVRCVGAAAPMAEQPDRTRRIMFRDAPTAEAENTEPQRIAVGIDYYPNPDVFGTGEVRLLSVDFWFGQEGDGDGSWYGKDDTRAEVRVRLLTASDTWDLVPLTSDRTIPIAQTTKFGQLHTIDFSRELVLFRPERTHTRRANQGIVRPEGEEYDSYRPISLELLPMGDDERNARDAFIGASQQRIQFTGGMDGVLFTGPYPPYGLTGGRGMVGEFNTYTLWGPTPGEGAVPDIRNGVIHGWMSVSQRLTRAARAHRLQIFPSVYPYQENWRLPYVVWRVEKYTRPMRVSVAIDLGSTPAEGIGEWRAEYTEPPGTRVDISGWSGGVPIADAIQDGDLIEGRAQNYRIDVVAHPSPDGWSTPELHELGVEFFATTSFRDLSYAWDGNTQIDPVDGRASIAEVPVEVVRGGLPVRQDGGDRAARLVSENYATDLQIDLWLASDRVPERLHLNRYRVARRRPVDLGEQLTGVSLLDQLQISIPRFQQIGTDGGGNPIYERPAVEWLDTDLADVLRDLLQNVINIPDREIDLGSLPVATGYLTSMRIEGTSPESGKAAADQVAWLCGGALDWESGRVTYVDLFGLVPPGQPFSPRSTVAVWDEMQLVSLDIDPGLEHRLPEFYVAYQPDKLGGTTFEWEVRSINADALELLGVDRVEEKQELKPELARWCNNSIDHGRALAEAIGWRMVRAFGAGFRRMEAEVAFPQPWIRRGAQVVVITDKWTDRIPQMDGSGRDIGRPLRGRVAVPAIVIGRNERGTRFQLWVRDPQAAVEVNQNRGQQRGALDEPPHVTDFQVVELERTAPEEPPRLRFTCTFPNWPYLQGWVVEAQKPGEQFERIGDANTPEIVLTVEAGVDYTFRARARSLIDRLADSSTAPTVQLTTSGWPQYPEATLGLIAQGGYLYISISDVDPSARWWHAWYRMGAWPTLDGTATQNSQPDPHRHIIDLPTSVRLPQPFSVVDGTHYVIARMYDNAGRPGPLLFASLVVGGGDGGGDGLGGLLTGAQLVVMTNIHRLKYQFNAAVEAGGHFLRIVRRVNGGDPEVLAANHNPKLDGASDTVPNEGYFDAGVFHCVKGSAGCVLREFAYDIELWETVANVKRQTLQVAVLDWGSAPL